MGIIKRQSLKSSIVNYAGVLLGVIFFNFIFPHLLSAEHLGMIRLLQSLMFMVGDLVNYVKDVGSDIKGLEERCKQAELKLQG